MIDKNKQYKTRDGREVRIYATDGGGIQPVHGAVCNGGNWSAHTWCSNGSFHTLNYESGADLIEVKPRIKHTVWVNAYPDKFYTYYDSKRDADASACSDGSRLACFQTEFNYVLGEGL